MKKTMKKAVPIELTLSISAMIIAIASITVSIWEGYTMREHYHLSLSPRLDWVFSSANNQTGFVITNKGLGPAIVTSRHIYIDGEKIDESKMKFPYIIAQKLFDNKMLHSAHTLDIESVIDEGEDIVLYSIHNNNNELFHQWKEELRDRVVFEINYESLYGEKYNIKTGDYNIRPEVQAISDKP